MGKVLSTLMVIGVVSTDAVMFQQELFEGNQSVWKIEDPSMADVRGSGDRDAWRAKKEENTGKYITYQVPSGCDTYELLCLGEDGTVVCV